MTSLILNPAILFCLVWGTTLVLYSLEYSALLTRLEPETLILVVGCCAAALVGWLLSRAFASRLMVSAIRSAEPWPEPVRRALGSRLRILSYIWLAAVVFELAYFGNLPFLSLFGIGAPVLYTEYGFSGLHGLLNAMQLVMFDMALLFYIKTGSRKHMLYAVALLLWSVLMVTRAVIMASIVQGIMIGLIFSARFRKRFVLLGSSVILAVILAFGALGDLRSSEGATIQEVAQQSSDYPDYLPAGFFWVYVYVTTPLNNINANIHSIASTGFPYYTILPLLPNVVKNALAVEDMDVSLVDENLNVSSFFRQFLFDYGIYGTIFVVALLYLAFSVAMAKSQRSELWSLILVVILFSTVMSVFVNAFTAIIYIMQMLIFKFLYFRGVSVRRAPQIGSRASLI
jgi:oligosaccharide repeat unit polymerase